FGILYASALLAFTVAIRHGPHSDAHPRGSVALVLFPLVVTWVCDTCAMAAGTLVGGPKLAPVLSPRKTWAGAVGGIVGGLVAALTAYSNADLLERQAAEWRPAYVGLVNGGKRGSGPGARGSGAGCLIEAATHPDVRVVVNGIVGAAGLEATLAALRAGKRVA